MEIITENVRETQKAGRIFAEEVIKSKSRDKIALVIGLEGELGSGKTTFIQGLAQGLSVKKKITSPTFVIFKKFELRRAGFFKYLYHIDCYRLESHQDLTDLGFGEIINQPSNLVVIEWAEKVKKILPAGVNWLKFEHFSKKRRKIAYAL